VAEISVDIVVVSYQCSNILVECVSSLSRQTKVPHNIWVVDNASTDNAAKQVLTTLGTLPNVHCKILPENIFYGPAANVGIDLGTAPYVGVFNNDILVPPGYDQLYWYLWRNPDVGVIGPKLVNTRNLLVGTGVTNTKLYHTVRGMGQPDKPGLYDKVEDVIYVGGSALFFPREVLNKLKERDKYVFDPGFQFYFEDYDCCLRIRQLGYKVQYAPLATLIHHHEASLKHCKVGVGSRMWRNEQHASGLAKFKIKWLGIPT
jgi:GT2 family glycosyltransferase